jgi:hypothetical protein
MSILHKDSDDVGREQNMSYLRTSFGEIRWLLVCAPLLGGFALNACLADSTSSSNGGDMMGSGGSSSDTTTGSGGDQSTGSAGDSTVTTGAGGSNSGVGGSNSTTGTGGSSSTGAGGSMGAGGSGQTMTGSMTGLVAGGVRWVGRVDASNPAAIKFGWGGSGFVASVTGTSVAATLSNTGAMEFQPVVDGKPGMRVKVSQGMTSVMIGTGLAAGMHTVELYRETEAFSGVSTFMGITGATLNAPPMYSGRLIETIGDSLSNGYGELGTETHPNSCSTTVNGCGYTIDTQSNYQSYTAVMARALNADWSIVANSGWGLYRDNGNGLTNVMGNVYNETYYVGNGAPTWDFKVKAQAVVINLGTNDLAKGDPGTGYQDSMLALLKKVRMAYGPDTWIFPVTGSMIDPTAIAKLKVYINGAVTAFADPKVFYQDLGTQDACGTAGTGCQWHPSVAEHKRLADVLGPVIKQKLGW